MLLHGVHTAYIFFYASLIIGSFLAPTYSRAYCLTHYVPYLSIFRNVFSTPFSLVNTPLSRGLLSGRTNMRLRRPGDENAFEK